MVRQLSHKAPYVLVSIVVALILAALSIGLTSLPLEAGGSSDTLKVDRAELDRERLRIDGEDAEPNATITVDGVVMGTAEEGGRFRVEADGFSSATCQVTVSDGITSVVVSLDRCQDQAPPAPAPPPPPPPPPSGGSLTVTRAELKDAQVRIEGEGAVVDGTIFIDGMGLGTADDQGRFRVEADDFGSASCLVTVGDGVSSVGTSLDGCTPTAPPPDVDPVKMVLTSTGVIPGASGQAELDLDFVADLGVNGLLARAEAEGLTPNVRFSMCVDGIFIDDDLNLTGKLVMDEGIESSLTSLSGLTVTIRQGIGCGGIVVLRGTAP